MRQYDLIGLRYSLVVLLMETLFVLQMTLDDKTDDAMSLFDFVRRPLTGMMLFVTALLVFMMAILR